MYYYTIAYLQSGKFCAKSGVILHTEEVASFFSQPRLCAVECLKYPSCNSFNYDKTTGHCQLVQAHPNGTDVVYKFEGNAGKTWYSPDACCMRDKGKCSPLLLAFQMNHCHLQDWFWLWSHNDCRGFCRYHNSHHLHHNWHIGYTYSYFWSMIYLSQ